MRQTFNTVMFFLAGLFVGIVVAFLGLGLTGAGDGWNSALISAISILFAPLAGLAWAHRNDHFGFLVAAITVAAAFAIDFALLYATVNEGFEYVEKALRIGPGMVLVWAAFFLSWQIWATATLIRAMGQHDPA